MTLSRRRVRDFENRCALIDLVEHRDVDRLGTKLRHFSELLPQKSTAPSCNQARARFQALQVVPTEPGINHWHPDHSLTHAFALVVGPIIGGGMFRSCAVGNNVPDIPRTVSIEPRIDPAPFRVRVMPPIPVAPTDYDRSIPAWRLEEIEKLVRQLGAHGVAPVAEIETPDLHYGLAAVMQVARVFDDLSVHHPLPIRGQDIVDQLLRHAGDIIRQRPGPTRLQRRGAHVAEHVQTRGISVRQWTARQVYQEMLEPCSVDAVIAHPLEMA